MKTSFNDPEGYIVTEATFDSHSISATGCMEMPVLTICGTYLFRGPATPGCAYEFRAISCRLSPFDRSYIAESRPARIGALVDSTKVSLDRRLPFEIPLDQPRLLAIERIRNGRNASFKVDITIEVDELAEARVMGDKLMPRKAWSHVRHFWMTASLQLEVSRSQWGEHMLPQLGFGKIHLFELPVAPLSSIARYERAFNALQSAQHLHGEGHYTEAVLKCRIALEQFMTHEEYKDAKGVVRTRPILKPSWKTRLGDCTYDWLNKAMSVMKKPGNESAHGVMSSCDQFESAMVQAIVIALVGYAARNEPEQDGASA